jgi:NAD(P)-dependent dehydrogenase (short-subunit alcohol dehydrogenase family)
MLSLTGRVVFITGASRGLGLELARVTGARGARIAICARDAPELDLACDDLRSRGIDALAVVADVRSQPAVERAVAEITDALGPVDVLINNAGTIQVAPLDALTLDDYRAAMETHFWAAMYAIDAVLPAMRARKAGRIVNIASIGGRVSIPHLLPYSASKFALVGYSEGLRAELARFGIRVTTVVPGLMRTGSPERATFKGRHALEYAWFSIGDALPFLSIDVVEAAQAIADAAERGCATLTLSMPAKLLSLAHGIAPGLVTDALGIVARLLPPFGGIGRGSRQGFQSHSALSPSLLTASTQRRSHTQNEEPV